MSKETKNTKSTKSITSIRQAEVREAVEALFNSDWEIPDSAIEGKYARKIEQLEAQVKSLTHRLLELAAKVEGKAPVEAGRVDVVGSYRDRLIKAKTVRANQKK